ncbi:type I toxin-antitoxin system SymE family toxin [Herbaspirillum sp. HC18]|nr:type I toxin-antitoxin system SymE family toxin [Herbaspirillum sp. HC18]
MVKRSHVPEALTAKSVKQERFLTVQLYPEAKPKIPWIRLRGQWLLQAGFSPQTRIRVRVMNGCLVITRE